MITSTPLAGRVLHDSPNNVILIVVDRLVRPQRPGFLALPLRADGGDNPCARGLSDLDGIVADPASRRHYEHVLTRPEVRSLHQHCVGRLARSR